MSWIVKELKRLRDYVKKPLDEPQDFFDYLVFGNRPHKMPTQIIEDAKSRVDDAIKIIKEEQLSPAPKPFIPQAPPLPSSSNIPPAPPLPSFNIPPAPPLPPQKELIPKPKPESVVYQKPEPTTNQSDKFLESIRQGTKLKPVKKPEIKIEKSFLDELKEKPKLTKKELKIIQKEVKKQPQTFSDLMKANKKFQALSRNLETKNEDFVDDFEGWGKKQKRKRRQRLY